MIETYGWSAALHADFAPFAARGLAPARVIAQHRGLWRVISADGEIAAQASGRFQFEAAEGALPVVGDWAALEGATIHAVLPRRGAIERRAAGGVGRQVLCANVDVALIAMSLNADLNPRRLERYLIAARQAQATPLIVLTKADLPHDAPLVLDALRASAGEAELLFVSAETGEGLDALRARLAPGETAALLGSSGVGKSTLVNALRGEDVMQTGAIRASDDRGRHTTRHREMVVLSHGGLLIDTPGLRELGLTADDETLGAGFSDVTALFAQCRFRDCGHGEEPGCAVQRALAEGMLPPARWRAYEKLQRENAFEARRDDPALMSENRQKWKQIHKNQRAKERHRNRNASWEDDG
jgi:ribosome biogenesis GTPase